MNKRDKKVFIRSLCNSIRDDVLGKVAKMPDGWDGHELRELLASYFDRERTSTMKPARGNGRRKDYENEVYIRNL